METFNSDFVAIQNQQMLLLLDSASFEDLSLPVIENPPAADLKVVSSNSRENDLSEDEFVDVEGGYDVSNPNNYFILACDCKSLQTVSGDDKADLNSGSCIKCRTHNLNNDDFLYAKEQEHSLLETFADKPEEKTEDKILKITSQLKCKRQVLEISKLGKPLAADCEDQATLVEIQLKDENFRCELCNLNFDRAESLECHKECHIPQKLAFSCFDCKKFCRTWAHCSDHLWKAHKIDLRRFVCDICKTKFSRRFMLINHLKKHLGIFSFACPECGKKFSQKSHLRLHSLTHIPIPHRPTKKVCPVCSNTYANHRSLGKHIREVHGTEKPFLCATCGFRANGFAALKDHQRSHLVEKPFKCTQCSFKTAYRESLRRHRLLHSESKKYQCPFCDASFNRSTGFKKHLLRMHPDNPGIVKICNQCTFSTIKADTYEKHLRMHTKGIFKDATPFADGFNLSTANCELEHKN